jgi:hypothetical protein
MTCLQSIALKESWKKRAAFTNGMAGTKLHNIWRSFRFTVKGKKWGCSKEWEDFNTFVRDMGGSYYDGATLCRKDKTKPFSVTNCFWTDKSNAIRKPVRVLTYNGETRPLLEWCYKLELNVQGVVQRYHRKQYKTPEEILFGKRAQAAKQVLNQNELDADRKKKRAISMVASYKARDAKKCHELCDFDYKYMLNNIYNSACVYCSSKEKLGADRIDNSRGHTKDNIVPACYRCNTMRQNHFTYEEMLKIGQFIKENIDQERAIERGEVVTIEIR